VNISLFMLSVLVNDAAKVMNLLVI
jgi:hypothetical protein